MTQDRDDRPDTMAGAADAQITEGARLIAEGAQALIRAAVREMAADIAMMVLDPLIAELRKNQPPVVGHTVTVGPTASAPPHDVDGTIEPQRFRNWSSDQTKLGRKMYERGDDIVDIINALNHLPGATITHEDQIYGKAKRDGWQRAKRTAAPDDGSQRTYYLTDRWSPARDQVIHDTYPNGIDITVITAQVNALPGPEVSSRLVGIRATGVLQLRRNGGGQVAAPEVAPVRATVTDVSPARTDAPTPGIDASPAHADASRHRIDVPPVAPAGPAAIPRQPQALTSQPAPTIRQPAPANRQPPAPSTPRSRPDLTPRRATADQIRTWAAERGIQFHHVDALPKVNSKRVDLGLPPFELIVPPRRQVA
ncbi:MAG: hypothetical protein AB7O80_10890 [Acetobacteraceae bacterium]